MGKLKLYLGLLGLVFVAVLAMTIAISIGPVAWASLMGMAMGGMFGLVALVMVTFIAYIALTRQPAPPPYVAPPAPYQYDYPAPASYRSAPTQVPRRTVRQLPERTAQPVEFGYIGDDGNFYPINHADDVYIEVPYQRIPRGR